MNDSEKEKARELLEDINAATGGLPRLGDAAGIKRGEWNEKKNPRPAGECRACERFLKGALLHESPGTAKCCEGCDACEGAME